MTASKGVFMMERDVIIIGGGPAGLTAGIYVARSGLNALILEGGAPGGRAGKAPVVENYPGFPEPIKGIELIEKITVQAKKFGVEIRYPEEVVEFDVKGEDKVVKTKRDRYGGTALIISIGTHRRKLLVPGEIEFLGSGVSYCAVCDGMLFKNRTVAIIGAGNEAGEEALLLADIAKEVIVVPNEELKIVHSLQRKIEDRDNITVLKGSTIKAIEGDTAVKSIIVVEDGKERGLGVNGVFVSLGAIPITRIIEKAGIELDERGCIKVDRKQRTNIEGVFAAGDCTCGGMQIVTAAGEGATAGMRASGYVKSKARE